MVIEADLPNRQIISRVYMQKGPESLELIDRMKGMVMVNLVEGGWDNLSKVHRWYDANWKGEKWKKATVDPKWQMIPTPSKQSREAVLEVCVGKNYIKLGDDG